MGDKVLIGNSYKKLLKKYEKLLITLILVVCLFIVIAYWVMSIHSFPITVKIEKKDFIASERYKIVELYHQPGDTVLTGDKLMTLKSYSLSESIGKIHNITTAINEIGKIKSSTSEVKQLRNEMNSYYDQLYSMQRSQSNYITKESDSLKNLYNNNTFFWKEVNNTLEKLHNNGISSKEEFYREKIDFLESQIQTKHNLIDQFFQNGQLDINLLKNKLNRADQLIAYNQRIENLTLDSLELTKTHSEIIAYLSSEFPDYIINENTLTIIAPHDIIVSYLPLENSVSQGDLLLSYMSKNAKPYAKAYIDPELATVLNPGKELALVTRNESSSIGKSLVTGRIETISSTPDKKNRYPMIISISKESWDGNLVHGLEGKAYVSQ